MGMSGGFSSGSRYGGFGSETGGFGGYQGEVYGDGGGFGGRETDFSDTQRRGDQFEEYDEGDDVEPTRPTTTATSTRTTPAATAKRDPPKSKEPEQDLFDFGDEPSTATTSNGKAPAISRGQTSTANNDDDDFDDFQSATSPATQAAINSLASLVPPSTTSTTTAATQFAAPKPVAPGQAAGLNNIFTTASPAPSASSTIISSSTSTFSPPPMQRMPAQPIQPTAYRPTGPNYFTSVPASTSSQPVLSSTASTPRSGMTPSYNSATSMSSLGKPTQKPASSTGGDAFGNLWSTASTKAGVKSTAAAQKGPDLASMAKAQSQAGIWGAASAASLTTARPGAMAPTPNTASSRGKPLGSGLDDLLG